MKKNSFVMLNVAPILPQRVRETTDDIAAMYRDKVITHNAFLMTLTPEGDPLIDKAAILAERFRELRIELQRKSAVPCGILLQATIGHGWTPDSPAKGQKFIFSDGSEPYIFCPLGEEFRSYLDRAIRTLAALSPDFFMLDDDFRMITGRGGCRCPLHIAGFNRKTGTRHTAETLRRAIADDESVAEAWDLWQQETLDETAQLIRKAMDETTPGLACSFCMCGDDGRHAPKIARSIAGNGPLEIRINNGLYLRSDPRRYPEWTLSSARQIAYLPEEATLLGEPDTCPQNRYSTSAALVHFHLTWSTLLGCRGGKLWLTRLRSWEPESGRAYREILAGYSGFYRTLAGLRLQATGLCVPLPQQSPLNLPYGVRTPYPVGNWASRLFGVQGIAFHYARTDRLTGILAVSGDDCDVLSDTEIAGLLNHPVLLDGEAVRKLTDRGFAATIGVSARKWDLPSPTFEAAPGREEMPIGVWAGTVVLDVLPGTDARIVSNLYHRACALFEESEVLAPGTVVVNRPGGNPILMTATSIVPYGFGLFALLNETRKSMLLELLKELSGAPCCYLGDAELMVWSGRDEDGRELLAMVGLSPDPVENPCFSAPAVPAALARLTPAGTWEPLVFSTAPGTFSPQLRLNHLVPEIIRLTPRATEV